MKVVDRHRFVDFHGGHAPCSQDSADFVPLAEAVRTSPALWGRHQGVAGDARVGRLQIVQMGHWVGAVGCVDKECTRLAVVMGVPDNPGKEVACPQLLPDPAIARVAQRKVGVITHSHHELVGDRHRNVEIGDLAFLCLAADKRFDVRVVDAQHAHVGPPSAASLGDLSKCLVVDTQKTHRSGRSPCRGVDNVVFGAQTAERKTVAAAGLLDQGSHTQGAEDAVAHFAHIVFDREDKACGQLP